MRREHKTHTTEDWHNSPLPKGSSWALKVPPGRGGGRSGGPSGQTWTGRQDGDLQSKTDRSEAMAELGALAAMAELGAQEALAELGALAAMAELGALAAMAELGALMAMAEQGALEAMAVQGAQEAMAGRLRSLGLSPLGPAPTAGTLTTPPKKIHGAARG